MKNVFNPQIIKDFKSRIQNLSNDSVAQWGKMDAYQMVKHCIENEKMLLLETKLKRRFLGVLFGKLALKASIKDDAPLAKNSPTHPDLKIQKTGDVEILKSVWTDLLEKYPSQNPENYSNFVHPFFGKMNSEQIGILAYKHIDHHLRQFGV
ncbi:MAG: hypothetical protein ACPGVB_16470 [Chitinophagales bacterium]